MEVVKPFKEFDKDDNKDKRKSMRKSTFDKKSNGLKYENEKIIEKFVNACHYIENTQSISFPGEMKNYEEIMKVLNDLNSTKSNKVNLENCNTNLKILSELNTQLEQEKLQWKSIINKYYQDYLDSKKHIELVTQDFDHSIFIQYKDILESKRLKLEQFKENLIIMNHKKLISKNHHSLCHGSYEKCNDELKPSSFSAKPLIIYLCDL